MWLLFSSRVFILAERMPNVLGISNRIASVMRNSNYPKPLACWKRAFKKLRQSSITSKLTVLGRNLAIISSKVWALKEVKSISYFDCGLACGTKLITQ